MTMTTSERASHIDRSVRRYRGLLVVYPRSFRDEYSNDLVQSYRDLLLFSTDQRGVWWRTTRDLFTSALSERGRSLRPSGRSVWIVVAGLAALALGPLLVGPGGAGIGLIPGLILIPTLVLVVLPLFGLSRFWKAWVVRRTTGGAIARYVAAGIGSFVPATVILLLLGEDAGYFIFIAVSLGLILGSAAGILWAIITLATSRESRRQWWKPALVLVPAVLVLGFIIGASYNSYRQSLGPAGDHSVENASVETRALWEAADAGDVDEVVRLAEETCADPWVKFGGHNAKGEAETRELELPDELEPPYREISDLLGDYMDVWHHQCPQPPG